MTETKDDARIKVTSLTIEAGVEALLNFTPNEYDPEDAVAAVYRGF